MERILVVEDSPEIATLVSLTLRLEGYEVLLANTGVSAFQIALQEIPSLILMDVMIPGMTGFQVAHQLKDNAETRDIPIIFVTARHEIDDRVQGLEIAVDYIAKPFALPELTARVRAALRMQKLQNDLKSSNEQLSRLAVTDGLTGLYNRRGFDSQIEDELHRARRFRQPLGLAVFDLDRFKSVNDTYGHAQGDTVLQAFSQTLLNLSRRVDKVARFGGEEFAVLLPNTDAGGVGVFCEKVRCAVEIQPIHCPSESEAHTISITVSGGAMVLVPSDARPSKASNGEAALEMRGLVSGLFELADRNLYEAKESGRNRTITRAVSEPEIAQAVAAAAH